MHEDIEGGQIYDRPPLPCCLANKEQSADWSCEWSWLDHSLVPQLLHWLVQGRPLKGPQRVHGLLSLKSQWRQRHKGDLVPPLYDVHDPRVCTYLGPSPPPPPENFDSLPARVIGPKFVQLMGAPPVPSCTPASERQERSGPFCSTAFSPIRRNGLCPWI